MENNKYYVCYSLVEYAVGAIQCGEGACPVGVRSSPYVRQSYRVSRHYDCFAAERGDAAFRQAPSPQDYRLQEVFVSKQCRRSAGVQEDDRAVIEALAPDAIEQTRHGLAGINRVEQ